MDYDDIAEIYDDCYTSVLCMRENKIVQELLLATVDLNKPVLDVGCGTGLLLDFISPRAYLGIDPASHMLDMLVHKYPGRRVSCAKFEDVIEYKESTVISLFGSPSYIPPEAMDFQNMREYFMMFYRDGYVPVSHKQYGIGTPYYCFSKYGTNGRSFVFRMTDYVFVTSMEVDYENIFRRNGL